MDRIIDKVVTTLFIIAICSIGAIVASPTGQFNKGDLIATVIATISIPSFLIAVLIGVWTK